MFEIHSSLIKLLFRKDGEPNSRQKVGRYPKVDKKKTGKTKQQGSLHRTF